MTNIALGLFKLLAGAIFLILGILWAMRWWPQLLGLIKGSIGISVILLGMLLVLLSVSDFKN